MALLLRELKALSDEEFEKRYDAVAENTVEALNSYTLGLQIRENEKTNKIMKKWTIAIGIMTAVMLLATIANIILAVYR